ncbi:bolA-like protein 3 isoform X1 [Phyllopteryx taeniolatus]|uniref:bolA-like protein 3 isoform X1 n=1 Tax=Phyllopteryx taeniolatus TaxID=161469 RepID=UPI002AD2BA80|nr:bolA-like protein 3 isoform X1 [Phyllopteryx taeniolatus]
MQRMLACKGSGTGVTALRILCRNQAAVLGQAWRCLSTQTDGEVRIAKVLREKFPQASSLKVVDISGGCGAMYEVHIESCIEGGDSRNAWTKNIHRYSKTVIPLKQKITSMFIIHAMNQQCSTVISRV